MISLTLARLGLSRPMLVRIAPFLAYALFLVVESLLTGDLRWLYAARIATVLVLLACFWREYSELGWPTAADWAGGVLAFVVGLVVFLLWINLDRDWAMLGSIGDGFVPLAQDGLSLDWPMIVVRITGAALVVPVMEELFWRSFIQRWLDQSAFLEFDPQRGSLRALLLTAFAFGFEHNLWLAGIIAGLAYGVLYRYSGRLWPVVLAHGVTNLLLGCWVVHSGQWYFW